jgi:hypothetical protein
MLQQKVKLLMFERVEIIDGKAKRKETTRKTKT